MVRALLIALGFLAPFFMPWPFAVLICTAAAYFVPPLALVYGLLFEVLYGTSPVPTALIAGIVGTLVLYGVRHLVKTRIMGA